MAAEDRSPAAREGGQLLRAWSLTSAITPGGTRCASAPLKKTAFSDLTVHVSLNK
ncbi:MULTISPECIES: hypothetical protein [unclassified Streptomyces]|uniref:hypothetical protein n=1 Tax=unclassified Streptomyces TaxID=2593676 RepID=UPI0040437A53